MIMEVKQSYGIVVADSLGRVLLVQQYGRSWCPPKGRMEEIDKGNPIRTASRELREETGYSSVLNGGEIIAKDRVGAPKHRIMYAVDRSKSRDLPSGSYGHEALKYLPMGLTITRPTFIVDDLDLRHGWLGPMREITYFLGLCKDLDKVDFSGVRDKAITGMKFVPPNELGLMTRDCNLSEKFNWNALHLEDFKAITKLIKRSTDQAREAMKVAENN